MDDAALPPGVRLGGQRRVDRVLDPGYLDGLASMPLERLRELRAEADQEEADLSYLRRILQGRADILRAELDRRHAGTSLGGLDDRALARALGEILADTQPAGARGLGRYLGGEPDRVGEFRRAGEDLVADVGLDDLASRSADELSAALERISGAEQVVSRRRRAVHEVLDACSAEIGQRYSAPPEHG